MKINLLSLLILSAFTLSACGEKPAASENKPQLNQEVVPVSAPSAAIPSTEKTPQTAAAAVVPAAAKPASAVAMPAPAQTVAKPAAPTAQIAPDQFLAETIQHAQAVTKSENSAARKRGQRAEDELMMEVAPPK